MTKCCKEGKRPCGLDGIRIHLANPVIFAEGLVKTLRRPLPIDNASDGARLHGSAQTPAGGRSTNEAPLSASIIEDDAGNQRHLIYMHLLTKPTVDPFTGGDHAPINLAG